jgi:hypothetical protein
MIVPFQIPWDPRGLADLNRRLSATRWNDAVVSDWSYGMERKFLQQLIGYWRDEYDWAERRSALNRLPHFRATIDGYGLHFLHYRGRDPDAVPLLLMNGWPSSFVEYQHLAVLLSQGEPSFEVVVPTLPGFGFSDRQTRPYQVEPSDLYPGSSPGMGLKIMDYRARLMGGVIDVAARRGGGTRVQCICPAPARGPQNAAAAH